MGNVNETLFDSFELKGNWWLPGLSDEVISGVLRYHPENNIVLELFGTFHKADLSTDEHERYTIILGETFDGNKCTLLHNFESNYSSSWPGSERSQMTSLYLFIGKHYESIQDIKFSSIKIGFTNLSNWLWQSVVTGEIPKGRGSYHYRNPACFSTKLPNTKTNIKLSFQFKSNRPSINEIQLSREDFIVITPIKKMNLDWCREMLHDFGSLLTILIGTAVFPRSVILNDDNIGIDLSKPIPERIMLFFHQDRTMSENIAHPNLMIIPYKAISYDIGCIINKWFANANKLRSVHDLFFGTFFNPRMYQQFLFLALTQALESYHRLRRDGKYLNDQDWEPYRQSITNSLSTELDSDHKMSLKSRIRYGNEYSLRKRIQELIKSLRSSTIDAITPSRGYFTGQIVDTRNYFTHHDDNPQIITIKGAELHIANQRLTIFLTLILLKEIGIDEDLIIQRLRESGRYPEILGY